MTTHTPICAMHRTKVLALALSGLAALISASASQAQVTTISETSLNALNPTAVPITGTEGVSFNTYTSTVGTQTVTFTDPGTPANGMRLVIRQQDPPGLYGGDYAQGEVLLANEPGAGAAGSANGLKITFANAVSAFGFNFDPNISFAATDFTFLVTDANGQTTFMQANVVSNNSGGNPGPGTLPFFGVQDAGGNLITSITLFGAQAANPPQGSGVNTVPNDFTVGVVRYNISPTLQPPSVPEPGNIALLMGMAATGMGCFARRKWMPARK